MNLITELKQILPADRIKSRLIDRVSYASDAGFYQLIPKVVVQPIDESEIVRLFRLSHQTSTPIVFRAGGSSLSGQCITDGILVDLSQHWYGVKVEEEGGLVRMQPGVTGATVNGILKKWNCKIGPDPSSINTAMIGGILSNNASGMCCGVKFNAYHTLKAIRFILPNGKSFSTERREDYNRFQNECVGLFETIREIREEIFANNLLLQKIREKYKTKNTVGYSLNAFIDFEHPLDVFAHLLVGSEGTLAFIAEAVVKTVPELRWKSTALLFFSDIYSASKAIEPLIRTGAEMVELMDRASLRAVENVKGMNASLKSLPDEAAALLIEFQEHTAAQLNLRVDQFLEDCGDLSLLNIPQFTSEDKERDFLWKVRKGLFPAAGALRTSGTTVILEDLAFPVASLGDAIIELQHMFKKYDYTNAIIFGHAKDGNIHFVITQSFDHKGEVERYDKFLRDVVNLVVFKYGGTLKAEHGTGRNMAPFVETEWGEDAYQLMKRINKAADPKNLLNPGVIINEDKNAHIKNLKPLPRIESEVDKCIECGYCEHRCPSRNLTLTPRRRITVRRALVQLKMQGDKQGYNELLKQYQYDGLETCAVDGLCATTCPVEINTGDLVKRLREENHSLLAGRVALLVAKRLQLVEVSCRFVLSSAMIVNRIGGEKTMYYLTKAIRKIFPGFPLWNNHLNSPPSLVNFRAFLNQQKVIAKKTVVYFPACISRLMGQPKERNKSILEVFISISKKAGIHVVTAKRITGLCCGQIFSSKGYTDAYRYTATRVIKELWALSKNGEYPVVTDISSCTYTLKNIRAVLGEEERVLFDKLHIMDSVEYLSDIILNHVEIKQRKRAIVLHPVCSLYKMGIEKVFKKAASFFADNVIIPRHAGCCGMAGDRGFLFPELTTSAMAHEASEVMQISSEGHYSSSRTCEIAIADITGKQYESILYLVDECT